MKRPLVAVIAAIALVAASAGGFRVGSRTERAAWKRSIADAQTSKTLVGIQRDIQLLTVAREKKPFDWVKKLELWTVVQLQQVDPSTFVKGSGSDNLYSQTMEMVNGYRKQYPDTAINPEKDRTIAKAFRSIK